MNGKIELIYSDLIAYLHTSVDCDDNHITYEDQRFTEFNKIIAELDQYGANGYERFMLKQKPGYYAIDWKEYKAMLSATVRRLHTEFFNGQPDPFVKTPTSVVNHSMSQYQNQMQNQEMIVDLSVLVGEKRSKYEEGSPERKFLDELRDNITTAGNTIDKIRQIFEIAKKFGLSIAKLISIFN